MGRQVLPLAFYAEPITCLPSRPPTSPTKALAHADMSPQLSASGAGYSLALLSWSLFISVFLLELRRYSPSRTYLWRFPAFLVFAAQLAKLQ